MIAVKPRMLVRMRNCAGCRTAYTSATGFADAQAGSHLAYTLHAITAKLVV
jgi:hypothetical protein